MWDALQDPSKEILKVDFVAMDPGSDVGCASAVTLAGGASNAGLLSAYTGSGSS